MSKEKDERLKRLSTALRNNLQKRKQPRTNEEKSSPEQDSNTANSKK
ncbi:MAG TPA: hypothetical protein VI959_01575 [Alphaproteobacteria bacterium]|nr:hypothetical protein [Alphaproteobacteria bacterium]